MFFELDPNEYHKVLLLYLKEEKIFPLVLAVIRRKQRGWVFVNDITQPTAAIIMNNFGFMQTIGMDDLDDDLASFFKISYPPMPSYILWYFPSPKIQTILDNLPSDHIRRRERTRFIFRKSTIRSIECPTGFSIKHLDEELIKKTVDLGLNINSRFWESTEDFLKNGIGACVLRKGEIVSLCYSACIVDNLAEIDVFTQAKYRKMGFAAIASQNFITECVQQGIIPTWDCFVNNTASMKLASFLGFEQSITYPFYSFNIPIILKETSL